MQHGHVLVSSMTVRTLGSGDIIPHQYPQMGWGKSSVKMGRFLTVGFYRRKILRVFFNTHHTRTVELDQQEGSPFFKG